MPKELRAYLESLGLRSDASDAEAWKLYKTLKGDQLSRADTLRGEWLPEGVTEAPTVETEPVTRSPAPQTPAGSNSPEPQQPSADEIRRAERERIDLIRSLGSELQMDDQLVTRAIDSGWNEAEVNRHFLAAVRDRRGAGSGADNSGHVGIHSRSRDDANRETLGAALMLRSGLALDNPAFQTLHGQMALLRHDDSTGWLARGINDDRRQRVMDVAHRFAAMSMIDICRECIRMDGGTIPGGDPANIFRAAVSGGSLANVFTTNVHARMIATYMEFPDSTRGWVAEEDNANFQTVDLPKLQKGGGLKKLPRGDSAEHRGFDDKNESYKLARYAEQFAYDEQDAIDDNVRVLNKIPREMTMDAARLRPDLVYSILFANAEMADTVALFHASRGNLRTGAAFSQPTLQTALTDMSIQRENGVELNLEATHVIHPKAIAFSVAKEIASAEIRNSSGSTDDGESGTANPIRIVAGNLIPVKDSRLDNGVTDPNTGTAYSGANGDWFLADANNPAIEVGYRRGTGRAPQLDTWQTNGQGGAWFIGFAIKHDIGAKSIRAESIHKSEA